MSFGFNPFSGKFDIKGIDTFLKLSDTPSSFSGQSSKILSVNSTENALEFVSNSTIIGPGTINEIAYFDTANTVASLAVATYPSLTELAFLKGTTSSVQTQLNAKQASITVSDTHILYSDGANNPAGTAAMTFNDAATAEYATFTASPTASSGTAYGLSLTPNFSGITGTGGYTGLFVNATDGSGSGTELLADFQQGGTSRMVVTGAGNVGIGTTGPVSKLHVFDGNITINEAQSLSFIRESDSLSKVLIGTQVNGSYWDLLIGDTSALLQDIYFRSNGLTHMTITDSGNVGIGTTSPLARLGIVGADALNTSFAANVSGSTGTGLVVTNAGNVGIGTTAPGAKLDVVGSIFIESAIQNRNTVHSYLTLNAGVVSNLRGQYGVTIDARNSGNITLNSNTPEGNGYVLLNPTSGNVGIGTTSPDRLLHAESATALTNTVSYAQRLTHITSGTPANNIGVGMEFEVETAADNNEVGVIIEAVAADTTATAEDFDLVVKNMAAGAAAAETFRITSLGSITVPTTITAVGTTGNQTINKAAGRVNIAASGTTVTVTNSLVSVNSIILAVCATADATARVTNVVPGAGSFVINIVATTAEVAINWVVIS